MRRSTISLAAATAAAFIAPIVHATDDSFGNPLLSPGQQGNAVVINHCSYPVYINNTPSTSMNGCSSESDIPETDSKALSQGETYSQQFTALCNSNGWSIKFSNQADESQLMQFEYTFTNADTGTVWIDMSDVNGNWLGTDWHFDSPTCGLSDGYYVLPTSGVGAIQQSCPASADVTLSLCPSNAQGGGSSSAAPESSGAASTSETTAAASTPVASSPAAASPTTAAVNTWTHPNGGHEANAAPTVASSSSSVAARSVSSSILTTLVTTPSASPVTENDRVFTVTEMATAMYTEVVTATTWPGRHQPRDFHRHHARHGHAIA